MCKTAGSQEYGIKSPLLLYNSDVRTIINRKGEKMFSAVFFWALLGLLLIGSEMLIPGFTIFFFGLGGLLTSLLTAVIPGLSSNFGFQGLIWAGSSILSFIFLRKHFKNVFKGTLIYKDSISYKDIGKRAEVIEEINPEKAGRIRFQGTSWKAVSYTETFKKGEKVEILKEEGLTCIVTRSILSASETIEE